MDWEQRYHDEQTPWELHGVTPALEALLASERATRLGLAGARVAVPGCGRGHDVRALAQAGAEVTGFDIAPSAVAQARHLLALNGVRARIERRDVFGLVPEYAGAFDLIYDYTCLCALEPSLRPAYADVLVELLADGGILLVLAFPMLPAAAGADGPPYLLTEDSLRELFAARLELVETFVPERSAPARAGAERWFVWRRR